MESGINQESVVPRITRVHDLRDMDMESAYDETQCSRTIHHGDVLLVQDGIAILHLAWPMMVVGTSKEFHSSEGLDFLMEDLRNRGMLSQAAAVRDGFLLAWAIACG